MVRSNGATIIAPMTVAVESPATPAEAIMAARMSSSQKRLTRARTSVPSKNSRARMRATSSAATIYAPDAIP
jgi:hypothetical protein